MSSDGEARAKANFRSFANPGKLAPPGRLNSDEVYNADTLDTPKPAATFEKIALPFFRWFGATANTPGIRKIQVGVYHETDAKTGGISAPDNNGASSSSNGRRHIMQREGAGPEEISDIQCRCSTSNNALSDLLSHPHNLFERDRRRYPRRDILIQLSRLVVKHYKAACFPWLDEGDLLAGAEAGELPAILANALCAVGAQFSSHPDLLQKMGKTKGEPFSDMAKVLIVPMLSWPSLDVIEALLILSYSEFALGADSGLWMYIGMAMRMATDLGLQHEATIKSMSSKKQQDRARLLFWAIIALDRITCFGTGRSVSMHEDSFDCHLPTLQDDPLSDGFIFGHIIRTLLKRGRIGELLNRSGSTKDISLEDMGRKLQGIWHDVAHYYETLPPSLQFGVTNFQRMADTNKGAAFVYLHILLQSIMSLLNRPSLLRRFNKDFDMSVPSKLTAVANQASGTIVSILRFAEDASLNRKAAAGENPDLNPYIDCNPYLDQLILPAGRAFIAEKQNVKDTLTRLGYATQSTFAAPPAGLEHILDTAIGTSTINGPFDEIIAKGQYAQMNLMTCQRMLDRLALWWSGADWPARALRQEIDGTDDDNDNSNNHGTQPAPIRDVEMVLKWARAARGKKSRIKVVDKPPLLDYAQADTLTNDLISTAPMQSQAISSSESNLSGDSPVGLGFSGQFSTNTQVDAEALINAWTNQGVFGEGSLVTIPSDQPSILPQIDGSMNLDFTTMQLEEFFTSGLASMHQSQQSNLIDPQLPTNASSYGWDDLPIGLLNAFTFHDNVNNAI
jgi:hypothetical protein